MHFTGVTYVSEQVLTMSPVYTQRERMGGAMAPGEQGGRAALDAAPTKDKVRRGYI